MLSVRDSDSTTTVTSGDAVTITYNDCNSSLNGTITFNVVTLDIRQNRVYGFGGSVSADLSGRRPASSFTLRLDFEFEFTDDAENTERVVLTEGDYTWTTTTTAEPPESVTVTATGLSVDELYTALGDYTISVSGRVDDEGLGGSFEFAPREACSGSIGNYPDTGSVKFSGSQSALVIAANSDPYYQRQRANYGVNATSTADPETSDRIRWREFQDGLLFGVFEPYDARFDPDPRYDQAPYFRGSGTHSLNPRTRDDLEAAINAYDPEGAELVLTYAWFRNGERLEGLSGPTLSAAEHVKGDVISLEVTASDGRLVSTLRRDITIQDTLPTFSLLSIPPAVVTPGETVSFQVGFDDVDGDPLPESSYQVDYGPGGLEIDADGRVTWTAGPLMFDRAMDYHWGVSAPELAGSSFSGVIRVEDPSRDYPLIRSGIFGPQGAWDLAMGDFDSDGIDEMLVIGNPGSVVYELQWTGETYEQTWAYPFGFDDSRLGVDRGVNGSVAHSVAAGDADGDGIHEFYLSTAGLVVKLDDEERRVSAVGDVGDAYGCRQLEYSDVDSDNEGELICLSFLTEEGAMVVVLDAQTLALEWRSARCDHWETFTVGDVDDDDHIEYIRSAGSIIVTGLDLEVAWNGLATHLFGGPFSGGLDATVAPGEQRLVFSAVGHESQELSRDTGPRIVALDPGTGTNSVNSMNIGEDDIRPVPIQATNYDLDGADEIFLVRGFEDGHRFAIWDIAGEYERWASPTHIIPAGSIAKDDVTGDGRDDFIVDSGHPISVYDLAGESVVWESVGSGSEFTLGDLDADGSLELIAYLYDADSGQSHMNVYSKSAEAVYELRTSASIGRSVDVEGLAVGDSDGNGEAELFVLTYDLQVLRLDADLQELSRFTIPGIERGRNEEITESYLAPPAAGRRNVILPTSSGDRIFGVDPINGAVVWKSPPLMGAVTRDSLRFADIDGDGETNLILATEFGILLTR